MASGIDNDLWGDRYPHINWDDIKADFLAGMSYGKIAQKHNISKTAVFRKAKSKGWEEERDKVKEKAIEHAARKSAETMTKSIHYKERIRRKLLKKLEKEIDDLPESIGSMHHKNITERQSTEMVDGGFKSSQKNIHTEYRIKDLTTSWQTLTADLEVAVDSDALTEAKKILDTVQTVID